MYLMSSLTLSSLLSNTFDLRTTTFSEQVNKQIAM